MSTGEDPGGRSRFKFLRDDSIDGQHDLPLRSLGLCHDIARGAGKVGFHQRFADVFPLREQECVGHGAADDQDIHLVEQIAQQVELGRNLCAADDRCKRPLRVIQGLRKRFELGLHRAPGIGWKLMTKTFGGSVRAVRGRECVVHPNVAELCKLGNEGGVVLFLARMKAGVFQAHDVAGLHRGNRARGRLADAVVGEPDRPFDDPCNLGGDRFERMLGVAPLRAPEMRQQDDLAAFVGELGDRRRHTLDTCRIRHHSVLDRHIQVDAE